MRSARTLSGVLGIVAGGLALFGTVAVVGVELPLATMPLSAGRLADALLTVSESLRSMPIVQDRVAQGNPWAVGRGVAGLELMLTPGLGLAIGGFSGGYAFAQALLARRHAD